jgi:putative hydrolase of the HAD superfamily
LLILFYTKQSVTGLKMYNRGMIKAIIFDCFGVLVTDALQVIVDELRSRDPTGADEVVALVRSANRGIIHPDESSKRIAEILGLSIEDYRAEIREGEAKDMRLLGLAASLRPRYKTAILSNIGEGSLLKRFTNAELDESFDAVVASGEIGYAKPEPEAYEITADRLGVRLDECVFTDDRLEFCEAARAVGMRAIDYKNFSQFKAELEKLLDRS